MMTTTVKKLRMHLSKTVLGKLKRELFSPPRPKAYIPRPYYEPKSPELKKVLLIAVNEYFNQDSLNAVGLVPTGFARGWAEACGPAKIVPASDLMREVEQYDDPAVFWSQSLYRFLTNDDARKLRNYDVFVWVHIHPRTFAKFERLNPLIPTKESDTYLEGYAKLMLSEPKFVWNAIGKAGMEWYQGWVNDGLRWESIFLAADAVRYFPEPNFARFGHIKMTYVGGYWSEKAQAFDMYLRPWEDIIVPFGYARWPYKYYGGQIDEADERQLYSSTGMIPLVTSPAGWMLAEITERYFKAPACKAFCIADQNTGLREIFTESEMLRAESPEHFHKLVREFLAGEIDTAHWAEQAYKAVQERHLYRHRTLQIKRALEIQNSTGTACN